MDNSGVFGMIPTALSLGFDHRQASSVYAPFVTYENVRYSQQIQAGETSKQWYDWVEVMGF